MGLGTKIKNVLHGDNRDTHHGQTRTSSSPYEQDRLPGTFPSDVQADSKMAKQTNTPSTTSTTSPDKATVPSETADHSTLKKSTRHRKTDSGVGFADDHHQPQQYKSMLQDDYERPVSPVSDESLGGIENIDNHRTASGKKQDPYWGSINRSGYEKDLPSRPANHHGAGINMSGRDVAGSEMYGNGTNTGPYGRGLDDDVNGYHHPDTGVGLGMGTKGDLNGTSDDPRIRDRDMGRTPTNGLGTKGGLLAGTTALAASETARRHHDADLRESGYHSRSASTNSPKSTNGGLVSYGRSASVRNSPTKGNFGASSQQQASQQSHFVPRVLHTCTHCGEDNDISGYFRTDASYRLG